MTWARIVVTDNGIRIPQDAPPHFSEEFLCPKRAQSCRGDGLIGLEINNPLRMDA
jgi:hypothetical protein